MSPVPRLQPPSLPAEEIYLHREGRQEGPFGAHRVREMMASGVLHGGTMAWKQGHVNWMPVDQLVPAEGTTQAPAPAKAKRRTPGLGVAGFVVGITGIVAWVALLMVAGIAASAGTTEESPIMMVVGLLMMAGAGINLLAAVFCGIALAQKNSAKVLSILGLTLNLLELAGIVSITVIGMTMG